MECGWFRWDCSDLERLRKQSRRPAEQVRGLAQVRQVEHEHEHAREAHAETAVRRHPVAEEVEVEGELIRVQEIGRAHV